MLSELNICQKRLEISAYLDHQVTGVSKEMGRAEEVRTVFTSVLSLTEALDAYPIVHYNNKWATCVSPEINTTPHQVRLLVRRVNNSNLGESKSKGHPDVSCLKSLGTTLSS